MTVSSTVRTAGPFTGTGLVSTYPFAYKVFEDSDVVVQQTATDGTVSILVLDSDYTVVLNGDQDASPGGSVVLTVPLASGVVLELSSDLPLTQPIHITNAGGFFANIVEQALDRLTIMIQQGLSSIVGAIRVPEIGEIPTLPVAAARANKLLSFDANGQPVTVAASSQDATSVSIALGNYVAKIASYIGTTLIGFIQAGAGAVLRTLQSKLRETPVTPFDFGAVGNGGSGSPTDDAAALAAMFATGKPYYIPPFKFYSSTAQTINSNGTWDGYIVPATSIGANPAVIFPDATFGEQRIARGPGGIYGSAAHQTAGVIGFRIDCAGFIGDGLVAFEMARGYVVRMYSVTLRNCSSPNCTLPNSAYARDSSHEINAFHIDGGRYSGGGTSWIIGDTSWPDAMGYNASLGTSISHGVVINLDGGANFDGGDVFIDNVSLVTAKGIYFENSVTTGCGFRLGTTGFDGNLRNVDIDNVFFKNLKWAIKLFSAVNGIEIGRCFYTAVTHSALYAVSDLYHILYTTGDATASFTQGQEFHTGIGSVPVSDVTFSTMTQPAQGVARGVQELTQDVGIWYPGGQLKTAVSLATMNASQTGRFYTSPALTKAGTVSGDTFTFTTLSDCYAFNGKDKIQTSPAGAVYVKSVDYEAGTMKIDGGTTAAGAATVSQIPATFYTVTQNFSNPQVAPTTGTAVQGDLSITMVAQTGHPKGWRCTVAGSPGTWVSEGNL